MILKIALISFLVLIIDCENSQSNTPSTIFNSSTDAQLKQVIHKYLTSLYKDNDIDEDVIDSFFHLVRENSDVFHYLAEANTDPRFLPYLEKYFDLKEKFTGQPINTDVTVIFSHNPLILTDHDKSISYSGMCDFFTNFVFIDPGFWDHYNDNEKMKEAILFHEVGHCDLNRTHTWAGNDFSFMDIDTLELLLLPNPGSRYNWLFYSMNRNYYDSRLIARQDIDKAFEDMYQELFSIENTRRLCLSDNSACISQEDFFQNFKDRLFPRLKYVTDFTLEGTFEQYLQ